MELTFYDVDSVSVLARDRAEARKVVSTLWAFRCSEPFVYPRRVPSEKYEMPQGLNHVIWQFFEQAARERGF